MTTERPLLDVSLLETARLDEQPSTFAGTSIGVHGRYDPLGFVLRLSPEVHETLAGAPVGIVKVGDIEFRQAKAFSTLLHETVHWWQHIGSTYGLISSLSYPAEAHINYGELKALCAAVGFQKSIRSLSLSLDGELTPQTPAGLANIIVNNQFDFEAFRALAFSQATREAICGRGQFESMGHAFRVTYAAAVSMIGAAVDPRFEVVPNPANWRGPLLTLAAERQEGHYHGSSVPSWPVGLREIFEGQARFAQIQYLHFASGGSLGWDDFKEIGWLNSGPYRDGFDFFLTTAELDWPDRVDHPTVGLFLLVCDMAANPGACFPFGLQHPSTFLDDVDPLARFTYLARAVRSLGAPLTQLIKTYSREEYVQASEMLAGTLRLAPPMVVAEEIASWPARSAGVRALMREHQTFAFEPVNQPVRVLLAHAIAFAADKAARPEVFCWPGAWMAGERLTNEIVTLFSKHGALFVDKPGDKGVFPRVQPGRDPAIVHEAFQRFYDANVTYDMTRQWIIEDGPFRYGYNWLVQNAGEDEMKAYAHQLFAAVYGLSPDVVTLVG